MRTFVPRGGKSSSFADNEARLAFWLLVPTVAVVLAFVVFPMIWNLWLSFKPVSLADLRGESLTRCNFTLANYTKVFTDPEFIPVLLTTLIYTVSGSLLSILFGLMAALLVQGEFAGRGFLRAAFISPYIAPVVAVTFTWSFILDPQLGVINWLGVNKGLFSQPIPFLSQKTWDIHFLGLDLQVPLALTTVIFFEGWRYFPFAFLFIMARLQAIPRDLYHAASVDGATPLQTFFHVTLPQLAGVLSTLFLFRFIWTLNKFDDVFLLTGGQAGTKVLTIKVYDYAFGEFNMGAGSALAMVLFCILSVFLIFYFRWMVSEEG